MIYEIGDRRPEVHGSCFVAANAAVIGSVVMAPGSSVWWGATVRGDNALITLGENVNVQDASVIHTDVGIPVTLERNVSIGHLVMLHGCHIGENTLVGIGAIILNDAKVGRDCLIGAGALVPEGKVIPDGSLVIGVPGRVLRHLTPEQIAMNTQSAEHYVRHAALYRERLKAIG
jgi:carbonic anhydrase/acetyltransferase-like protein (isoleucine patch superfamily)